MLRYQAFPYQKFGLASGQVTNVAHSASTPQQVANSYGILATEPMYRIDVKLSSQSVIGNDKAEPLLPGMAVDADIQLDKRTLLEWLFEPFLGAKRKLTQRSESP
jgi:membrane fusion protein